MDDTTDAKQNGASPGPQQPSIQQDDTFNINPPAAKPAEAQPPAQPAIPATQAGTPVEAQPAIPTTQAATPAITPAQEQPQPVTPTPEAIQPSHPVETVQEQPNTEALDKELEAHLDNTDESALEPEGTFFEKYKNIIIIAGAAIAILVAGYIVSSFWPSSETVTEEIAPPAVENPFEETTETPETAEPNPEIDEELDRLEEIVNELEDQIDENPPALDVPKKISR